MIRRPPISTRTDTLFPYTTLCRSSDSLPAFLNEYKDQLEADVIVIADSGSWDIGVPALTTSLRGLVRADVEVRTLTHAVHSGMWRSEEHTSELQSLIRISYAVFCLKKKTNKNKTPTHIQQTT